MTFTNSVLFQSELDETRERFEQLQAEAKTMSEELVSTVSANTSFTDLLWWAIFARNEACFFFGQLTQRTEK